MTATFPTATTATTANVEQVEYWNGAGGASWVAQTERLDRQLEPLGHAALAALAARPGQRILDVGCGAGQTTRQLAEAVGPNGRVVGLDISAPLLALAARRNERGWLSFVRADAQTHRFDEPFDAIFSRFGVMFFADPVAAFTNLRRALTPTGRLVFVCWRTAEENPVITIGATAAARHLVPEPPPAPDAPGPFAFADRARLAHILDEAGFDHVTILPHDELIGGNDRAATLELALEIGPLGRLLRAQPDKRALVIDDVRAALEPFFVDDVARMPSATWIVTAAPVLVVETSRQ